MNKTQLFLRNNSDKILTVIGATGVVVTAVFTAKATPKALLLIEEAKEEKGEELTTVEVIKTAWKPYIPAVISGVSTIICIFGANHLSTKHQASLMSAYALLDNAYKEYRERVNDIYGDEADINVQKEIVKSKFDPNIELQNGLEWFFDSISLNYFKSTMDNVLRGEAAFLEGLESRGYASLNELYDCLNLPRVDYGYTMGWTDFELNDPYDCKKLSFNFDAVEIGEDKTICWIMSPTVPLATDYII